MMKGHTTIELTNVKTGEVERVEDDNMFTQAIPQMMNFISAHCISKPGWTDINSADCWKSLLGGIYLFESSVDDSAILPVGGNRMVGCGSVGYINSDGNLPEMGSYNNAESDTTGELVKKFVYDYTTNQANGTISSVCLTSQYGGYYGAGSSKKTNVLNNYNYSNNKKAIAMANIIDHTKNIKIGGKNTTTYGIVNSDFLIFCIDSKNDLMYSFNVSSDKLRIGTHKMAVEKFDLFRSASDVQSDKIEDYDYHDGFVGSYFYYFYNTDEKILYFWTLTSNSYYYIKNESFPIYKFDITNRSVSKHCDFRNNDENVVYRNLVITNEFIYATYAYNKIKKINIINMSSETIGDYDIADIKTNFSYIINGIITLEDRYKNTNTGSILIDTRREDAISYSAPSVYFYNSNLIQMIIPPIDSSQLIFGSESVSSFLAIPFTSSAIDGCNTWAPTTYLATINNLGSPVVKTADKTMKITYTITAEDAEE